MKSGEQREKLTVHLASMDVVVDLCNAQLAGIFVPEDQLKHSIASIPDKHYGVFVYGPGSGPDFCIADPTRIDGWLEKLADNAELTFWAVTPVKNSNFVVLY